MPVYLRNFKFLGEEAEKLFFLRQHMTCYNNFYPFGVLHGDFVRMDFAPITILYGGNGSGKSTVLNILAEKLHIPRSVKYNSSSFFLDYINDKECQYVWNEQTAIRKILTSDDVFRNLFSLREKNAYIDREREHVLARQVQLCADETYLLGVSLLEHTEELRELCDARRQNASTFAKERVGFNYIGKSNGETAIEFFSNEINQPGLFLLDEPENSLSAVHQVQLRQFLWEAARFFGAQLVIATHSPFLLSIPEAKIYNLDTTPVSVTHDWASLANMQTFYRFFKENRASFEKT